ncbi:MAG: energy transducer TonB [Bacteroidota bacterium]
MDARKNPKLDADKRKPVYFQLGLMVVSACATMAFTWRTPIVVHKDKKVVRTAEVSVEKIEIDIDRPKELPKTEKVAPTKKVEPKTQKLLHKSITKTKNVDRNEQHQVDLGELNDVLSGNFDVEIGEKPELEEAVKYPKREASFAGDWKEYLKGNLIYPEESIDFQEEGDVWLTFIVERDGSLTDIEVLNKNVSQSLQKEAIRVIKASPNWNPGVDENGAYVRSYKNTVIHFKLK